MSQPNASLITTNETTTTSSSPQPSAATTAPSKSAAMPTAATTTDATAAADRQINALIEQVFAITVTRSPPPPAHRPLIYMEEIAPLCAQPLLNVAVLDQALFERLLLHNAADFLIPSSAAADAPETRAVCEQRVLSYLLGAYVRNARHTAAATAAINARIAELIVRNAATAVKQPDLYEGQRFAEQLLEQLRDADADAELVGAFVSATVRECCAEADAAERANMRALFGAVFDEMRARLRGASLGTVEPWVWQVLQMMAADRQNAELAMLLIEYNGAKVAAVPGAAPADQQQQQAVAVANGAAYENTLWGDLLRISIVPKQQGARAEYFQVCRRLKQQLLLALQFSQSSRQLIGMLD